MPQNLSRRGLQTHSPGVCQQSLGCQDTLIAEISYSAPQNLSRRGLHATALEYAKLLLSLDPEGDPRGVLCCIDYLALRAQRPDFLLVSLAAGA